MAYYQTVQLGGNPVRGLELVRDYFIHHGFRLTEVSSSGFKAVRPKMKHIKQEPLWMLREVSAELMGSTLTLQARTAPMLFVMLLALIPVGIAGGAIGWAAITESAKGNPPPTPILFLPLVILVIVVAVFGALIKVARQLLDVVLENAVMISNLRETR